MKKMIAFIAVAMLVFTLSSCTTNEIEITIMIYSEDPVQTVSDLEDLPEVISNELLELGFDHDRIVLQSSDQVSAIIDGLANGTVDVAFINPTMVQSDLVVEVLSVAQDEINHPDGDTNTTTYQKAIVVSSSTEGESFKLYMDTAEIYDFTVLNALTVCSTTEDESYIEEFATYMGMTTPNETLLNVNHVFGTTQEVFEQLEATTCDLGIVNLEDVAMYQSLWDSNALTVYESIHVVHVLESVPYGGVFVSVDADEYVTMSLVQALIQFSAHSVNNELLDLLGHGSYYIPE